MKKFIYRWKKYEHPKIGVFIVSRATGSKEKNIELIKIIGEDKTGYIYELKKLSDGILPLSIHKTRLIKWVDTQLTLF